MSLHEPTDNMSLMACWSSKGWPKHFFTACAGRTSHFTCGRVRGVDHGWGSWPLKICRRGQSMFWHPKISHSFIQNCCWITLQVSHHEGWKTCQKWKVELIFRGTWNSLMAWPPDRPCSSYFTTDLHHWCSLGISDVKRFSINSNHAYSFSVALNHSLIAE